MPPKGGKATALRACLICTYLAPSSDFLMKGCPNCEDVLEMRGSLERVQECTSQVFDGMIAMLEPSESWVARWQRIDKKERGLYAVRVTGRPPADVIQAIEERGGRYVPRDVPEE